MPANLVKTHADEKHGGGSKTADAYREFEEKIASSGATKITESPKSAYDYSQYAYKAASEYLKNKVPLNDSISKIASQEGLNAEQIKRVSERSNTMVFESMYEKNAEDRFFTFKVADPSKIIKSLQIKEASETVVKNNYDYIEPFNPDSLNNEKKAEDIKIDKTKVMINKIAGYEPNEPITQKRIDIAMGKMGIALDHIRQHNMLVEEKYASARGMIHDVLKEHILQEKDASYIKEAAERANVDIKIADIVLSEEEQLLKDAGILSKEDFLSGGEIKEGVDQSHPFWGLFRTIEKCSCEMSKNKCNQEKIKKTMDSLRKYKKEIK